MIKRTTMHKEGVDRLEKKWMGFKRNFEKCTDLKIKSTKLKDVMEHLSKNEYNEEKFKWMFLKNNKEWFSTNISTMFTNLLLAESKVEINS